MRRWNRQAKHKQSGRVNSICIVGRVKRWWGGRKARKVWQCLKRNIKDWSPAALISACGHGGVLEVWNWPREALRGFTGSSGKLINLLFVSKQGFRCHRNSRRSTQATLKNGSGEISLFTNEVPAHWASNLHAFNYGGQAGWEIPAHSADSAAAAAVEYHRGNIKKEEETY